MSVYEIPLQAKPQTLSVQLNGATYGLTVTWCQPMQNWTLAISDASGNLIVSGIPLVTGVDLLAQYKYLGIGVQLLVQTDHDTFAAPTFTNLGQNSHLYVVTV